MIGDFHPGDWVLAQWQGGRFWYPGVVHSIGADGAVAIRYDDGSSEIRPGNQVKSYDWKVGSRIHALWPGDGKWYEAVIVAMEGEAGVTVCYEDGVTESTRTGRCRSV